MVLVGAGFAAADITGPDVASYQHPGGASIDWSQVKDSGRNFAFVKATEGVGYVNPYFSADWAAIQANGMVRGSYHYAKPDSSSTSAAEQARYFVATAGLMHASGDLAPVLDLEETGGLSPRQLVTWVHAWLSTITALTGRTPIIYTYPYFWRSAMGNDTSFTQYPLWIADYNGGSAPNTPLIGGWSQWTFWQYTDRSAIAGISTGVDDSRFSGTSAALSALANGAPAAVTGPPSAILAQYTALGGAGSVLDQICSAEYAVPGGRAQNFTGGRMYWSPATGAHEVHGAILGHYLSLGGPSSTLGLPTTEKPPARTAPAATTSSPPVAPCTGHPPWEPTKCMVPSTTPGGCWAGRGARRATRAPTSNPPPTGSGAATTFRTAPSTGPRPPVPSPSKGPSKTNGRKTSGKPGSSATR